MGMRREAREALAAAGQRPRKRWGQHFLCDARVVERIVEAAALDASTAVVEIGPGLGALTEALVRVAGRLVLVEIDPGLAERLHERFAAEPHVRVLCGDVLALSLDTLVPPGAVVVANLPYNISTPVLFRLLDLRRVLPRAVLMLQREVAERIVAPAGAPARGILGVLLQTYAEIRTVCRVPPGAFLPPPRVDSAVIAVRWHATPRVAVGDDAWYRRVVRAAFGQRRKMLRNALAALAAEEGLDGPALAGALARAGIDPTARAERLELVDFARLADALRAG